MWKTRRQPGKEQGCSWRRARDAPSHAPRPAGAAGARLANLVLVVAALLGWVWTPLLHSVCALAQAPSPFWHQMHIAGDASGAPLAPPPLLLLFCAEIPVPLLLASGAPLVSRGGDMGRADWERAAELDSALARACSTPGKPLPRHRTVPEPNVQE